MLMSSQRNLLEMQSLVMVERCSFFTVPAPDLNINGACFTDPHVMLGKQLLF